MPCAVGAGVFVWEESMKGKKQIKLYNMMLPIWLLWIFPITWLVVIPLTFLTDSVVLLVALKVLKQNEIKGKYKKAILNVWLLGFVADIPGLLLMIAPMFVPYSETGILNWWYNNMTTAVPLFPFSNMFSFLYIMIAVGVSFVLIYVLNMRISLKNIEMDENVKKRVALALAVFTAPWLFFLPSGMFYM
jgi:hypothetical protein